MEEIWKDIPGFEGLYQVSNYCRVKALDFNHTGKEGIMKLNKLDSGHYTLVLCKNGKQYPFGVHRLMAMAFIPIPEELKKYKIETLEVHHIDGDGTRNYLDNLMWVTRKKHKELHHTSDRIKKICSKRVGMYTLENFKIKEYSSAREAARQTGYSQGCISEACRTGKIRYNHLWKYI